MLEGHGGQRAYILGQAPGVVEGEERRPWRGRAGQTLRRWLAARGGRLLRDVLLRVGDALLPGTRGGRRRRPDAGRARAGALRALARMGARLLRPALIVPVGGLAIRRLLGLTSLDASIGERFSHGDAVAVPLPHPSGVSRWLNAPANQARLERAVELVHGELGTLSGP